jgi:DNA invertase Pin-like site-specific DNA recombinase
LEILKTGHLSVGAVIFARVSKQSQDWQRQVSDLTPVVTARGWHLVATITEKGSASKRRNAQRPEVQQLRELVASGQVKRVLVTEVSRLSRLPSQAHALLEELSAAGVSIYIHRFAVETLLPSGKLNPAASMIFAMTAEWGRGETEERSERIISGQAEAKRQGKHLGRPVGTTKDEEALLTKWASVAKLLRKGRSVREIVEIVKCSKATVQKVRTLLVKNGELAAVVCN